MYFINFRRRLRFPFLILFIVLLALISISSRVLHSSAHSPDSQDATATFTVTNTNDSGAGSLRQAILDANASPGDDTIAFQNGLGTVTLTSSELLINSNIIISGTPSSAVTITRSAATGTPNFRIFNIAAGATVSISDLTISGGRLAVSGDQGGGIYNAGIVSVSNTTVSNNSVSVDIGGSGGGVFNAGSISFANSSINGNIAGCGGTNCPFNSGGNGGTGFGGGITNSGTITLNNSSIRGNGAYGYFVGLTNQHTARGGGIFNSGTVNLINSVVGSNTVSASVSEGGGIYNSNNLNVTNSLIVSNSISSGSSAAASISGGGIFSGGSTFIINSTVSNNLSRGGNFDSKGGGIGVSGTLILRNSTVSGNSCSGCSIDSGGIYVGGSLRISNTIVALNYLSTPSQPSDIYGSVTSEGYNLIGTVKNNNTGWVNSDQIGTTANPINPQLGVLQDNGGPTLTQALLAGSPAINRGNNADAPATDQRGFARIVGGTVDIGAFEVQTLACDFTINPTNQSVSSSGENITVNVTSATGCSWTASSNTIWITVTSGSSGNGNGVVSLSIQPNTGIARTGTVTIAGQTFTVNQASGCLYALNPTSVNISANGENSSFNLTSGAGCAFTAVSNNFFITINSGASGTGNGTVSFSAAANTGAARTGTITVGGQTFTVNQASGCAYSLSPTNTSIAAGGGNGNFSINTSVGCPWTVASNDSWITITSAASGTGSGNVSFSVQANSGIARTGTITAANQTFTINQAGGCSYSLSSATAAFAETGGNGIVNVSAAAGCPYSAVSNDLWITITSGANGTGSGTVTFSVGINNSPGRTGTITIAGQTFTVTQANGCSFTIFPANLDVGAAAGTGSFRINAGEGCMRTAVSNALWITITAGSSSSGSGDVAFLWAANTGQARTGTITAAGQMFTISQAAGINNIRTALDFDGDGRADISVFRPDSGVWYLLNSTSGFTAAQFGVSTDKIVPADYDGDGKTDLAVYRNGTWYIQRSSAGFTALAFGTAEDIPQPADFDGDGKADLAVYRPSNGVWYVYNLATNQFTAAQFGAAGDKPVVGDYNGDGKADYAVFRPSNGTWYIARPSGTPSQNFDSIQFGDANDKPVPADYDGDGKTDLAVFRPSNGSWYLQRSTAGFTSVQFGISTDLPAPADYDGDGKADIAVFRNGTWYLNRTTGGFTDVQFGTATDKPVPNAFIP